MVERTLAHEQDRLNDGIIIQLLKLSFSLEFHRNSPANFARNDQTGGVDSRDFIADDI